MDLDKKLTITYVMSKMGPGTVGNARTASYVDTIFDCFEKASKL